jgi:futalosine hydrolase
MSMITDICSMYILLAAATSLEIQPTIDFLEKNSYKAGDHELEVLLTGVGAVATTYLLTYNINDHRPDMVIQAGIAGSFQYQQPGTVVAIKEEILGDIGVWEEDRFKTVFDLQLANDNDTPFTNRLLVNPYKKLLALSALEQVRSITVNEITTNAHRIAWYQQNLAPVVESMEGGALHYVCLQEQVPFIQIRALSNAVGERNKTKWNMKEAIDNLNKKLIAFIPELSTYDDTYFRL